MSASVRWLRTLRADTLNPAQGEGRLSLRWLEGDHTMWLSTVELCIFAVLALNGHPVAGAVAGLVWLPHRRWERRKFSAVRRPNAQKTLAR